MNLGVLPKAPLSLRSMIPSEIFRRSCPGLPQRTYWTELMAVAQTGDSGAYGRLLREVAARLRQYYIRRLPAALVENAVQDTSIAIHRVRHTFDPSRNFEAWLMAIARHKWIDQLRALKSQPSKVLTDDIGIEGHERAVASATVLEDLLRRLKPAQSQVIRLVKIQGYSVKEAAAHTGQSVPLVKVNIHRGLARLASMARDDDGA
jgi:RNA polymerase sigma factor (sigma-70 family)